MPRCFADPDGLRFHYESDEFSFEDFDKAGKLKIWTTLRILYIIGRWQKQKYARIFYKANGKTFPVAKFYHTTVHQSYYTQIKINFPCRMTTWISHVNQSGYWVETQFINRETGQMLQSSVIYVMIINRKTRKPVKGSGVNQNLNDFIPESLRRKEFIQVFQPEQKPPAPFVYKVSVSPSDTDHHQHLGNDGFMKYCLDGASAGASANQLGDFEQSISLYNVKDFAAVYSGEALCGDTMSIACWTKSSDVLLFEVTIRSDVVCHCKVTFYSTRPCNYEDNVLVDLDDNNLTRNRLVSKL